MKEEEEEEEMPQSIYRDAFATIHLQTWLFSFTTAMPASLNRPPES